MDTAPLVPAMGLTSLVLEAVREMGTQSGWGRKKALGRTASSIGAPGAPARGASSDLGYHRLALCN